MKLRIFALLLALVLLLAGCTAPSGGEVTTDGPEESGDVTTGGDATTAGGDVTTGGDETSDTTAEATDAVTDAPEGPQVIKTNWYLGYVGSSTHSSYANKLNVGGGGYSFTDIIVIPKAGTRITFVDDNTNSNGEAMFASASAYVFSHWVESEAQKGSYMVDMNALNHHGGDSLIYSDLNDTRLYTYITSTDNEMLRISFRSGHTAVFTPPVYPQILAYTESSEPIRVIIDNGENQGSATTPTGGTELKVNWNFGYVGSDQNSQGYVNKIKPSGGYYSYTDIIHIEKKGTTLSFTDDNTGAGGDKGFASAAAYVFSSWREEDGGWVIDTEGANFTGGDAVIYKVSGSARIYTYTTSKDNEYIRICYRSGQTASFTPSPYATVYAELTGDAGTVDEEKNERKEYEDFVNSIKNANKYPDLRGIKLNIIGDSYFAGDKLGSEYVWPALLAAGYEMTFNNYGKNGSTISDYVTTNNPMVQRYTQMIDNDPDIVIFEGGKNDYNKNVPIDRFSADVERLIVGLRVKYPNATLICVTPWKVAGTNGIGKTVGDYSEALKSTCQRLGVSCFDASDPANLGGIVDMTNAEFRAEYSQTPNDVSHLNAKGHRLVLQYFEKFIGEKFKK